MLLRIVEGASAFAMACFCRGSGILAIVTSSICTQLELQVEQLLANVSNDSATSRRSQC